jgi:pimeloyl-ACP methyl ester carboxylesterase
MTRPKAPGLFARLSGEGPSVLLLHGQPGSIESWDKVAALLEADHRVVVPDRPGYGQSGGEAESMAGNARLLATFLEEGDLAPATVVAHSWAGGPAVLLAAERPDLVSGLILVGAACTSDSIDDIDRWLVRPVLGKMLTVAGLVVFGEVLPVVRRFVPRLPERFRDTLLVALPDESLLGGWRRSLGRRGTLARHVAVFMKEQRALLDELDLVSGRLGGITVPTIVVTGRSDLVVRPAAARTLAASIPGATLEEVEGAGHFVARDNPAVLARAVRSLPATGA